MKTKKISAEVFDAPPKPKAKELTPAQRARLVREGEFRRILSNLNGPGDVFAIMPEPNEKAATLRLAFTKAAREAGKNVVLRSYENGFAVALSTPEREKSRRGRKPAASA